MRALGIGKQNFHFSLTTCLAGQKEKKYYLSDKKKKERESTTSLN